MNRLVLVLALVAGATSRASADTLPLITGVPAEYTPHVGFSFEVRAPGLVDYSAFSLELVFQTPSDWRNTFTVYGFTGLSSQHAFPNSSLPFPFSSFRATTTVENDGTIWRLTLSDFGPPANTTAGVNDLLAYVGVGAANTGPISFSVNPTNLFFTRDLQTTPIITAPDRVWVINPTAPPPNVVPTPTAWLTMSIGLAMLALRRPRPPLAV